MKNSCRTENIRDDFDSETFSPCEFLLWMFFKSKRINAKGIRLFWIFTSSQFAIFKKNAGCFIRFYRNFSNTVLVTLYIELDCTNSTINLLRSSRNNFRHIRPIEILSQYHASIEFTAFFRYSELSESETPPRVTPRTFYLAMNQNRFQLPIWRSTMIFISQHSLACLRIFHVGAV